MQYRHSFEVRAPQTAVAQFHSDPSSMGAITPPPVIVQMHSAPAQLSEGATMEFTLWVGPLPLRWLACIEQVTPVSFVDRQLRGPFAAWRHLHTYVATSPERTLVLDQVEVQLSRNWWWKLVGLGMVLSLPILFGYRGWKTRRILGKTGR